MLIHQGPVELSLVHPSASPEPSPSSPPPMTDSKSSKSSRSSLRSPSPAGHDVLADVSHFEEITLEDEAHFEARRHSDFQIRKASLNPYSANYSADLRAAAVKHKSASTPRLQYSRPKRDAVFRPDGTSQSSLSSQLGPRNVRNVTVRATNLSLSPDIHTSPLPIRAPIRSSSTYSLGRRRTPSPSMTLNPRDPRPSLPRRSSWQSNRERKTVEDLELECDEDDGDDIPDGLVLDNVPISPRPPQQRAKSQPSSKAPSPERGPKDKARSVGNGTPAIAKAQGSLRSPSWKSDASLASAKSATSSREPSPVKSRAMSWNIALAELNAEAKALTEKLEEHAEEVELKSQRSSTGSIPTARPRSADGQVKPRVKSALAELPPLRRTNIMIDPLPVSKEKEAVLSRTRPSWLPPKDPAEERRHLKEYQKMMAQSLEAERRREAAKRAQSDCRDTAADSIMQIWEQDILPRWNSAIRERRTRQLWWRGVAPRSRGAVWSKAVGNDLGLTEGSYQAALSRAQEAKSKMRAGSSEDTRFPLWFKAIDADIEERTWRGLRIFQADGPLHESLVNVLRAYAMYRSDIGYVSGCNTIAALLLLNMPTPASAFIALANLLNRSLPLSFFAADAGAKASAYNLMLQTLAQKSPALHEHIINLPEHDPEFYLDSILTSLLTSHLAIDEAARLWDVYVFEGDSTIIRAGVALLLEKEMSLLGTNTMAELKTALAKDPSGADKQRVLGGNDEEDKWMRAVRDAGKSLH